MREIVIFTYLLRKLGSAMIQHRVKGLAQGPTMAAWCSWSLNPDLLISDPETYLVGHHYPNP